MKSANPLDIQRVLEVVQKYHDPTKRITKSMIATALHLPYSNSHNNGVDRSIRDAVTELRKLGHPICADSGHSGYYFSTEGIGRTIAEYESRATEYFDIARAMERGYMPNEPEQMRLSV